MTYEMTDDPRDPCALCVFWEEPEFMHSGNFEEAVPWASPSVRATRIYQAVHDDCEKAVMEYIAESSQ